MARTRTKQSTSGLTGGMDTYVRSLTLLRDDVPDLSKYPFSIPALRELETLDFHPQVTFFVGENGSGKSTLVEGIAVAAGFNAEGGSRNFNFATRRSESSLHEYLRLARGTRRPKTGYFLRAESFFNVATETENNSDALAAFGSVSPHEMSHGEAFLTLVRERFSANGLYVLDEPEAALSPQRQLSLLRAMHELTREGCQFIISTHSPLLLAYPDARIYHLSEAGIAPVAYEDTEHYSLTRDFLLNREAYLHRLFKD
ncbi:AAA family ATPase [Pyxidicoccus xibeiensis]|uniref:AAA family ATPase n=1 Tax=Pyxidicoccus xibeiensis TaxID=2906759 RepID=UPI0020A6E161|nr:AAA family ATPase [Pyxidicoccus xibeiensis]MCP3144012.1 AAA family ATPase [Pyxidicoccus xibeiensis]